MSIKQWGPNDSEAVVRRCSARKMLIKVSQNSQESTSVRVSFLMKLLDIEYLDVTYI